MFMVEQALQTVQTVPALYRAFTRILEFLCQELLVSRAHQEVQWMV